MGCALVPEFAVTDVAASLGFYCDVLGFAVKYARPEDGFAYLTLGGAELMLDQIKARGAGRTYAGAYFPDARPFGRGMHVQIEVPDTAPMVAALARAGHDMFIAPHEKWYRMDAQEVGHRQFVVADPDGYLLRFYSDIGVRPHQS